MKGVEFAIYVGMLAAQERDKCSLLLMFVCYRFADHAMNMSAKMGLALDAK